MEFEDDIPSLEFTNLVRQILEVADHQAQLALARSSAEIDGLQEIISAIDSEALRSQDLTALVSIDRRTSKP